MAPRAPREVVELEIETLAAGGDGLGRGPDGRVVFVPFTAPGDRVRVEIVERRNRFARGVAQELTRAAPGRTDPLCPVFGQCGGCAWQHLAYPVQLEAKRTILHDALERIARLPVPAAFPLHPSPEPYGYRSRARVLASRGRVGFRRRRSSSVCATRRCPILVPELDRALAALADDPPRPSGEWELSVGIGGRTALAPFPVRDSSAWVEVEAAGERLRVSSGSFVQANALLREALLAAVVRAAGTGKGLLELFAGAGFFTLALARGFRHVVAVESNPIAVADLEENLTAIGMDHVDIAAEPAERVLEDWRVAMRVPDVVVLDPPRVGLEPEARDALATLGAPRIVYVSCDPATLARDLGVLGDRGYELEGLEGFDLFPQTPHVEAVAVMVGGRR